MVYGDLQLIDIIVFAGIAAFLIYRLRNVLGKRGGFEKQNIKSVTEKEEIPTEEPLSKPLLKENEKKLSIAYDSLDNFDHKSFLEGAKFAFEAIINAFNKSDKKTLKNLLTKDVFSLFEKAIDLKENNPNFQFYSLVINSVEDVVVENGLISITLKITSEQFKDDDESTVTKKLDQWTFQKKTNDKSPNWLLSAT
jgi:predicted lipid-binding transport protein (Tim44 family)